MVGLRVLRHVGSGRCLRYLRECLSLSLILAGEEGTRGTDVACLSGSYIEHSDHARM